MGRLLDFDPDKWARNAGDPDGADDAKVANLAKAEPTLAGLATLAGGLDATLLAGIERLRSISPPKRIDTVAWRESVADALRLVSDGWASQALALGWAPLDLFGAVTDPHGTPDDDGLAIRLRGRRVLAISEGFATVAEANGGRTYLYRGDTCGAQLLWAFGGGQ